MRNKELLNLLRSEIDKRGLDGFVQDLIKFIKRVCIEHNPYTPVLHRSLFNSYDYFIYSKALEIAGIRSVHELCEQIDKDRAFLSKLKYLLKGELYKFINESRSNS